MFVGKTGILLYVIEADTPAGQFTLPSCENYWINPRKMTKSLRLNLEIPNTQIWLSIQTTMAWPSKPNNSLPQIIQIIHCLPVSCCQTPKDPWSCVHMVPISCKITHEWNYLVSSRCFFMLWLISVCTDAVANVLLTIHQWQKYLFVIHMCTLHAGTAVLNITELHSEKLWCCLTSITVNQLEVDLVDFPTPLGW